MLMPFTTTKVAFRDGSGTLRCETHGDGVTVGGRWEMSLREGKYRGRYEFAVRELDRYGPSLWGEPGELPEDDGTLLVISDFIVAACEAEGMAPKGHAEFYGRPPRVTRRLL